MVKDNKKKSEENGGQQPSSSVFAGIGSVLLLMPLIGCPAFAWDGIFIGATASRDLRNSTLLCAVGFFAVWFIGKALAGPSATSETAIHILMGAYFAHLAVRTLYLSLRAHTITV